MYWLIRKRIDQLMDVLRGTTPQQLLHQVWNDLSTSDVVPARVKYGVMQAIESGDFTLELVPANRFKGLCYVPERRIVLAEHTPVVLFHELVHLIGGNEFDAEVMETLLYPFDATPPDSLYDAVLFLESNFQGKFCYMKRGCIWAEDKQLMDRNRTLRFMWMVLCSPYRETSTT